MDADGVHPRRETLGPQAYPGRPSPPLDLFFVWMYLTGVARLLHGMRGRTEDSVFAETIHVDRALVPRVSGA